MCLVLKTAGGGEEHVTQPPSSGSATAAIVLFSFILIWCRKKPQDFMNYQSLINISNENSKLFFLLFNP